jgi:hypothetical protein
MYKPEVARGKDQQLKAEAGHQSGFESYEPMGFSWETRGMFPNSDWKINKPVNAPPIEATLPQVIEKMVQSTWKWTEPSSNRHDMKMVMGSSDRSTLLSPDAYPASNRINPVFKQMVRPGQQTGSVNVPMNGSAIATDWNLFNGIERVNAITFRGDSRKPIEIFGKYKGFQPPETRTDDHYLHGAIHEAFADYYKRRYNRNVTKTDFLKAIDEATGKDPKRTKVFIDYMTWRGRMRSEASHLGRMASHECLKGYTSTSPSIDSAINFGYRANPSLDGYYIYVLEVQSGFVVPDNGDDATREWSTGEGEIAQFGPVPKERIHGFRKFVRLAGVGPIYIRESFRKAEPKAFETVFQILSGAMPSQVI